MGVETVKYFEIVERCKSDIAEILPAMPKENTYEAWERFRDELENIRDEAYVHASDIVQHWDWAIYTHYGIKILYGLPLEIERQAEQEFFDAWGSEPISTLNDAFDMASRIASFALEIIFRETLEEVVSELVELAETQLENMGPCYLETGGA